MNRITGFFYCIIVFFAGYAQDISAAPPVDYEEWPVVVSAECGHSAIAYRQTITPRAEITMVTFFYKTKIVAYTLENDSDTMGTAYGFYDNAWQSVDVIENIEKTHIAGDRLIKAAIVQAAGAKNAAEALRDFSACEVKIAEELLQDVFGPLEEMLEHFFQQSTKI